MSTIQEHETRALPRQTMQACPYCGEPTEWLRDGETVRYLEDGWPVHSDCWDGERR